MFPGQIAPEAMTNVSLYHVLQYSLNLPIIRLLSFPAMNIDALCSLGLFGSLAVMGSSEGVVNGMVK